VCVDVSIKEGADENNDGGDDGDGDDSDHDD
jgi:hypothetical protein